CRATVAHARPPARPVWPRGPGGGVTSDAGGCHGRRTAPGDTGPMGGTRRPLRAAAAVAALAALAYSGAARPDAGGSDEAWSAAPSGIRDETGDVVDLVDEVLDAVRDHHDDPEAVAARLRSAVEEHPEAAEASASMVDWAAEHCQLDLSATLAPGPAAEGTTTT